MKNADMPAMPVKPEYINNQPQVHEGLTKREELAMRMLPEIYREYFVGIRNNEYGFDEEWREELSLESIKMADVFFKVLEEKQK